ncbi:DUF1273 family protein [Exiguobacterium sp. SH5S13]|uniref:SLOG family protein n=1 Tax=Exiguobacterium sp. SH5S13 TaxID=2510959 RepID=UPI0010400A89|nr:SLOG family protein [Exiguobacterium sp. SH5S13]TCI56612.1 DUF1273 family protein [Exiguobacterium sp. SH5S13]
MKVVAITGYRPHELGIFKADHPGIEIIQEAYRRKITEAIELGAEWFIFSGTNGCELWAGQVLLELRETHPIKIAVFPPFLEMEERYKPYEQELFSQLRLEADFFEPLTQRPYEDPSQLRAKTGFFLDKAAGLITLYDEETGGSPRFLVEGAKRKHQMELFMITQDDLRVIEEEKQWEQQWE